MQGQAGQRSFKLLKQDYESSLLECPECAEEFWVDPIAFEQEDGTIKYEGQNLVPVCPGCGYYKKGHA